MLTKEEAQKDFEAQNATRLAWLQKNGTRPVSHNFLHKTMDQLTDQLIEVLKTVIGPLKARIAELEARPVGPEYAGVYTDGKSYARGSLVSKRGGLWLALTETARAPGSDPTHWRLVVKSGGGEP